MDTPKTVLVSLTLNDRQRDELVGLAPHYNWIFFTDTYPDLKQIEQAHIILGNIKPQDVASARNLKWIQLVTAGVDKFVKADNLPPGAVLTSARGAYGRPIAEYLLSLLLTLQKNIHLYRDYQHEHSWTPEYDITAIEGSTTLVVGLGDIGLAFAQKMHCLGSQIIGVRRQTGGEYEMVDEVYSINQLDELLPRADIIALCLPGTPKTHHLIDSKRIGLMKKEAILLNIGRGSAIDTEALLAWLERGHLRSVALDVTDPEPLPPDHRLWQLKNVLITPHVAGGYGMAVTRERVNQIAIDNFRRFLAGQPLVNVLDFKRGY